MRKAIIAVIAFILMAANMQVNFAQGIERRISDIENHWSKESFERWLEVDIVQGNEMSTVEPDRTMTKIEYITVLNRLLGLEKTSDKTLGNVSSDAWYENEVRKALEAGYLNGTEQNGSIYVNIYSPLTRKETAKLFCRAFGVEKVTPDSSSFSDVETLTVEEISYIETMKALGSVKGYPDGSFKPNNILTRAELMSMLDKGIKAYYNTPGTYREDVDGLVIVNGENIVLKGASLKGNVIVTEKATKGIIVEDSTISGELIIRNSNQASTILIRGKSEINKLSVSGDLNFDLEQNSKIKLLNVKDKTSKVVFEGKGQVKEVTSKSKEVKVDGVYSASKKDEKKSSGESSSSASTSNSNNSSNSNESNNNDKKTAVNKTDEGAYELKDTFLGAPTYDCKVYEEGQLLKGVSLYVNGNLVGKDTDQDGVITTVKNYFDASAKITYSLGDGQIKLAKKIIK